MKNILDRIGPAGMAGIFLLAAALLCRFDHPLDECRIMNGEIDRRLGEGAGGGSPRPSR